MKKRSVDEITTTAAPSLSENINLFQSLRVLQEGESDDRNTSTTAQVCKCLTLNTLIYILDLNNIYKMFFYVDIPPDGNSVCLKTGWFSAILSLGGGALCLLLGALLATCSRLRKLSLDKVLTNTHFDGYMNHKGRIN